MKLKKLTLKNIRSYKTGEITFPSGSTLLSGDIGSGKTTILLSISFALFGLQPGQRGSSLLSNSSDNGKISLELEIQDKQVKIERSLRKSRNSVTQESCSITIDGEKKDLSITELKAKILTLLNYPMEFIKKTNILYNYTVYSPQEQMKQIILEDPESRLNVLRHVFGIDKYKKIRENLSIITSKLREKSRILQYEIRDLEETRITLLSQREFINLTSSKLSETQNELKEKLQFRELNQEELKKLESKLGEKQNFEKEIEKTNLILSYKMQESKKLENEISELSKKLQNLPEFSQDSLDRTIQEINNIKNLIEPLNKQIIEISANATSLETKQKEDLIKKERLFKIDICPTCLQDVSDTYKNNILNETEKQIVGAKKQLSILNAQKEKNALDLKNKKSLLTELEEKKYELELLKSKSQDSIFAREKCLQLKKQKENLQKDSELLEKHIDLLKNSVLEFSKYDNLHNLKEEELKKSFQKEKEKEISLAELNKELEFTSNEVTKLEIKIKEKEKAKSKLANILKIEQWLSSSFLDLISFTEKNIMLRLRNEFSNLFNKWFSTLATDDFYANLDETFTPIITQGDYELDYSFLSGGERTAVALAYRLALNQIINSLFSKINTSDLVILDEPTDGFSSQQLDKVRDILDELNIGQLIIVSHEQKIESFVDNVIKIKKQNGESKIIL